MNEQQYPSIYPCRNQLWIWLAFGIFMLGGTIGSLYSEAFLPAALFFAFTLLMAYLCYACTTRITLTPGGIEIYRLGRLLDRLPVENIHLILAEDQNQRQYSGVPMIYISVHDTDELVRLQIQDLKKKKLSPEAISARKQQPGWRQTFAKDYLHHHSTKNNTAGQNRKILCLKNTMDTQSLLRHCYPHKLPVSLMTHRPCPPKVAGADHGVFPRGAKKRVIWKEMLPVAALLAVPVALLAALAPEMWWFGLSVAGALLLLLYVVSRKENQTIHAESAGISLSGWRKRIIPAGDIKTIARMGAWQMNGVADYLLVSTLTPEEIIHREQQRLGSSRRGRKFMAMYAVVPDWAECCFFRWCARRLTRWSYWGREPLVALYHPNRERLLRRMYPNAQWLESPEGVW